MRFLCWFSQCRWLHIANVPHIPDYEGAFGLWQCSRCKTLSTGRALNYDDRTHPTYTPNLDAR